MHATEFKQTRVMYSILFVILIIIGLCSYAVINELDKRSVAAEWVFHTFQVIGKLDEASIEFNEADNQRQLYAFTHDRKYLTLSHSALAATKKTVSELKFLKHVQKERITDLEQLLEQYLAEEKKNPKRAYQLDEKAQAELISKKIKNLLGTLTEDEEYLLHARKVNLERERHLNKIGVIVISILTFLMVLISFPIILNLSKKNTQHRTEKTQLLRDKVNIIETERIKLEFILNNANIGYWMLNLSDLSVEHSLLHDQIFGYKTLCPVWTYDIFLSHVHPDDVQMVDQIVKNSIESDGIMTFECRIYRADDKSIRWIQSIGKIFQVGEARQLIGLVQDITDRK